ncbi:MAG: tetratricopeptide repeat protein [Clostridium sp.]|nr:tetratricopeptide repeat protein [Clostridium sp.]MCM1443915.1 tetratricopeptide repeat protein [Candidatus Amulumruptor caecigallinarius]
MKKFKICVYAISKNESKFVQRWVNSMKEADNIYVLDTGSIDETVNMLKNNNVIVKEEKIIPWRFDIARNKSLDMVPLDTDICICTDLDEVFEPGWRKKLEKIWNDKIDKLRYNYNWSLDENNKPIVNFYIEKIHTRNNYKWTHPVHEVLTYTGNNIEKIETTDEITVNHYPDASKSRSSYLELLEMSVEEDPDDDRNMHYLGREYMYNHRWNDSIDTLIKHLNLKNATWKDERCASMRFIGRCYKNLKRYDEAKLWYEKAIKESPYLRDPYIEFALLYYQLNDFENTYNMCKKALQIKYHAKSYINEVFSWNETVYDLLSISSYQLGFYDEALIYINNAIKMNPNDQRLKDNKKIIESKIK